MVRQNRHENELAFNAAAANLIMQPSLVLARHILLFLLMPSLGDLLRHLHGDGLIKVKDLARRSQQRLPQGRPLIWTEQMGELHCVLPGCRREANTVRLRDVLRDPADRASSLDALALVVTRGGEQFMLPGADFLLQQDDMVLLCGSRRARKLLYANVRNPYTLHFLATGEHAPRGWVFQWLYRRRAATLALRGDTGSGGA